VRRDAWRGLCLFVWHSQTVRHLKWIGCWKRMSLLKTWEGMKGNVVAGGRGVEKRLLRVARDHLTRKGSDAFPIVDSLLPSYQPPPHTVYEATVAGKSEFHFYFPLQMEGRSCFLIEFYIYENGTGIV